MKINNQSVSIGLLIAKVLKIIAIRLGFLWPTLRLKFLLKFYHCRYGKNLIASGKIHLRPRAIDTIRIGNNVTLTARFLTNTVGITNPIVLETIDNGSIEIGDNSGLSSVIISSRKKVKIGNFTKIGANTRIFDHDFHSLDYEHRHNSKIDYINTKSEEVIIGDDVFIGTNVIILKGTHIGARSIIGAGSIVALKKIPEDSIVFGNPAKIYNKF